MNKFKDIRKPYYTSLEDMTSIRKSYGISVIDITDNYYKNDFWWLMIYYKNVILFSILFTYICIDGLSVFSQCSFKIYSK